MQCLGAPGSRPEQIAWGRQFIHQPPAQGLGSGDPIGRKENLQRGSLADQAWQALRASPSSYQSQGCGGVPE